MVNKERDFELDIETELRYHLKCGIIRKDPNHFCTKKELAKNLKMSLRDLTSSHHGLAKMVNDGKVIHDKVIQKHKLCDKFTLADPNLYSAKDVITMKKDHINSQKRLIVDIAEYLVLHKPFHSVKVIHQVFQEGKNQFVRPISIRNPSQTVSKTNQKSYQKLINFCEASNNLLAIIESLAYAQLTETLERNEQNDLEITKIREDGVRFIATQIRNILRPLTKLERKVTNFQINSRIPTFFQIMQINRMTQLKKEKNIDPCDIDDDFLNL